MHHAKVYLFVHLKIIIIKIIKIIIIIIIIIMLIENH
jgi:hypothetical protein